MKSNNINIKKVPLILAGITTMILISVMMSSCKKPGITSVSFNASNLRVVNGLTNRTAVKFYLDTSNLTMAGVVNFNQLTQYYVVKSGSRRAKFYSTSTTDTFAAQNIQLDPNKDYTLFLAGDASTPKLWLTEDDLSSGTPDKVKLRLANLATTGVNIDVTIQLADLVTPPQPKPEIKVFSNAAPQSISGYVFATVPVSKGNSVPQLHTIRVYEAGTSNLLLTSSGIDLRGTDIQTFILSGINGGSPALVFRSSREWLDW